MKKVLEMFDSPILSGGQEAFVMTMLAHMDHSELKIDLLTPYYCDNQEYRQKVNNLGGDMYELHLPFAPGKSRSNILPVMVRFLKENQYDVVHIHAGSITTMVYGALAARIAKVKKIIVHSHCAGIKTFKHSLVKVAAMPLMAVCPTKYCACSQLAGEFKFSKSIQKKMLLVNNGIDLNKFKYVPQMREHMRKTLGIEKNTILLGHVGRFSDQKNHPFLIDVFECFHKSYPDSKLLLIGRGETQDAARQLISQKKLEDAVLNVENVNNVYDYLQAMDVFVLPSKYEGFPIVMVEAQATGLPVVVSDSVTREAKLTEAVQYISLEKPVTEWTKMIASSALVERKDQKEAILRSGFEVSQTAEKMRSLYMR